MLVEQSKEPRVCHPDWPVDLLRITVLKQDDSQQRYLRVKFQNVCKQAIRSVKLCFVFPDEGKTREILQSYPQYLQPGESGGLSYSVAVGNGPIREIAVRLVSVAFADGSRREDFSTEGIRYHAGEPIEEEYRMAFQYLAGRAKGMVLEYAVHRFYPVRLENGAWVCSCGRYCTAEQAVCPRCNSERRTVLDLVHERKFARTKEWLESVERQRALREERGIRRFEREKKEADKLRRRRLILVSCVLMAVFAVVCSGLLYYTKSYYPWKLYKSGIAALEQGQYGNAYICFVKAGNYRDAAQQAGQSVILRDRKSIAHTGTDFAAVHADGSVTVFSENPVFQAASNWTDIVSLSAGKEHLVGLKADGTVVAVGTNVYGECAVEGFADIVSIDTGPYHTVGLKADGTVVAVGYSDDQNRVCDVSEWNNIVSIAASATETMGLKADGSLVTTAKKPSLSAGELYYDIDCNGMTYEVGLTRKQQVVLSGGTAFGEGAVYAACAQDVGYAVSGAYRVVTSGSANPFLELQNVREIIVTQTGEAFCVTAQGTVRCGGKVAYQQQIEALSGIGRGN